MDVLPKQFSNLLLLKAAVEAGSINRAASNIGITQPAMTRGISRLEEAVGCKLIERGPRGIVPTEYGELLLERVNVAAGALQTADRELSALRRSKTGSLSCGASAISMSSLVPSAIHRFSKQWPNAPVLLVEATTRELLAMLMTGRLDVVVGIRLEEDLLEGLEIEPLVEEVHGVFARAGHKLADGRVHSMRDLLKTEQWVFWAGPSTFVDDHIDDFDLSTVPTLLRTQSTAVRHWYARATDYLVMSTTIIHYSQLMAEEVVRIATDWDFRVSQHVIYRRALPQPSRSALRFTALLKAALLERAVF